VLNGTNKGTPLVDEIACDPKLAHDLAPGVVAALLGRAHIAVAALEARLLVASVATMSPRSAAMEDDRLLTAKEMAARLSVPETKIKTDARCGRIPRVMVGRYVRFRPTEVEAALFPSRLTLEPQVRYTNGIVRK
jgi:excisionase family DNA binding protein